METPRSTKVTGLEFQGTQVIMVVYYSLALFSSEVIGIE